MCWSAGRETCVDMSIQRGATRAGQGLDGMSVIVTPSHIVFKTAGNSCMA